MVSAVLSLVLALRSVARSRAALHLEILALWHQLAVLDRSRPPRLRLTAAELQVLERSRRPRVRLTATDRLLWVWLSRIWSGWRTSLVLVQPDTVAAWHRRGF